MLVACEVGNLGDLTVLDPKDKTPQDIKFGITICTIASVAVYCILIIAS